MAADNACIVIIDLLLIMQCGNGIFSQKGYVPSYYPIIRGGQSNHSFFPAPEFRLPSTNEELPEGNLFFEVMGKKNG